MASDVIDGLRISVVGMSLTFLALGLLILIMVLLMRIFPERKSETSPVPDNGDSATGEIGTNRQEELAVAIAVGICLLEREQALELRDPSLGKLLEQQPFIGKDL